VAELQKAEDDNSRADIDSQTTAAAVDQAARDQFANHLELIACYQNQ